MAQAIHATGGLRIYCDLALTDSLLQVLREGTKGHELVIAESPGVSMLAGSAGVEGIDGAQVLFGQPDPGAIARAREVRLIQISSSGITRYDTPEFRSRMAERGIAVCNSADVFAEACAEHALSFMLAQSRRLPLALGSRLAHGDPEWHALRTGCAPLAHQSVLILGYGAIGERLAELVAPLRMHVEAYRRRARGDERVPVVTDGELARALSRADHVVNILPESVETRHFFDAARLGMVKSGAVFYNIGRGATVDQEALLGALESGRLAAAWLDVTEPEPLPAGHGLLAHPRCFITPHIAGGHPDEVGDLVRHFVENLRRFVQGAPLRNRVM